MIIVPTHQYGQILIRDVEIKHVAILLDLRWSHGLGDTEVALLEAPANHDLCCALVVAAGTNIPEIANALQINLTQRQIQWGL